MGIVKCKYCTEGVSGTNMSRHIQKHHPEYYVARSCDKNTTVNLQCRQVSRKVKKPDGDAGVTTNAHTSGLEVDHLGDTSRKAAMSSTLRGPLYVHGSHAAEPYQSTPRDDIASSPPRELTASSTVISSLAVEVSAPPQAPAQSVGRSPADVQFWSSRCGLRSKDSLVSPTTHPSTAKSGTPTDFLHGQLNPAMAALVTVAVQDLVESHHIYDAVNLGAAMSQNFPDLPAEVVPYVVVAAASAAQHVAHIHMMRELYMNADNAERRADAEKALTSMMSWAFGLRRSTPIFAVPVARSPSTVRQIEDADLASAALKTVRRSPPSPDTGGEK